MGITVGCPVLDAPAAHAPAVGTVAYTKVICVGVNELELVNSRSEIGLRFSHVGYMMSLEKYLLRSHSLTEHR